LMRLKIHELCIFACFTRKMPGWLEIHEFGIFARFTRKMPGSWLGGECFFAGDIF
jgi:hypothetical protein